ncbi:MAG: single-stranded DNA-binding protein, partial [Solirubrobacteraceae bacterium]
ARTFSISPAWKPLQKLLPGVVLRNQPPFSPSVAVVTSGEKSQCCVRAFTSEMNQAAQLDDDRQVCQVRIAVNDSATSRCSSTSERSAHKRTRAPADLTKGRAVAVTGRLVYHEWDDNGTRRSRHHIIGRVQFGGKPDEPAAETQDATEEVATF